MNDLVKQREYRRRTNSASIKKYEKTEKGFLMRLYRNMQSRIEGVQKSKFHLYEGKELLSREDFYKFSFKSVIFYMLFDTYKNSNFERKLAPSVDRIDSSKGYTLDNIEWVTMSENSKRGSKSSHLKNQKIVIQSDLDGNLINEFNSQKETADFTNIEQSLISMNLRGKTKTCKGYKFTYKTV